MSVPVVEDEVALALLLQKRLEVEGHEVDSALHEEDAFEYAQSRCMNVAGWAYGS